MSDLPKAFLERLEQIIPIEKREEVLSTFSSPHVVSFRTNTLKTTSKELQKQFGDVGFLLEQVPWYADAFILKNKSQRELMATELFQNHVFYIQNLSSMLPALVLDPKLQDSILDIAAAPGSKTTQIAALMKNQGSIIANDISRQRVYKLIQNLKEQGVTNTHVTNVAGQKIWQLYPEYFDKTLLDAPCSMEGRFTTLDKKSYQNWSPQKVKELANRQKYLLMSAISATKVGGVVVYSTCTLSPEENEGVIDWVLRKMDAAVTVEKIHVAKLSFEKGQTSWQKAFSGQVALTCRILPTTEMEGFYIAKIRKIRSTIA